MILILNKRSMSSIVKNVFHFILMILLSYIVYTLLYLVFGFLFAVIYNGTHQFVLNIAIIGLFWMYADFFIFRRVLRFPRWNVSKGVYLLSQVVSIPYFICIKLYSWLEFRSKYENSVVSSEFQNKILVAEMIFALISIIVVCVILGDIYDEKNID